jgi:hypothetical protein
VETERVSPIYIGFAGTLYDSGQLDCLISAIGQFGWSINERPIKLRIIGNYFRFNKLNRPANIELLGWRDTEATRGLLSECAFTYLPIPFGADFEEFARLAFPTKLSTYLAAGRPVLVHGPDYSAPVKFCNENGFGRICTSMNEGDLQETVMHLLGERECPSLINSVRQTFERNFSRPVMRQSFAEFLGVDFASLQI